MITCGSVEDLLEEYSLVNVDVRDSGQIGKLVGAAALLLSGDLLELHAVAQQEVRALVL